MHWLLHFIGADNLSGPAYGFWSGFGSDLGEVAIIGGLISVYRKHNCHVRGCWRLGRHPVEGTGHVVCRRHHPEGAPSHEHVLAQHQIRKEVRLRTGGSPDVLAAVRKLSEDVSGLAEGVRAATVPKPAPAPSSRKARTSG